MQNLKKTKTKHTHTKPSSYTTENRKNRLVVARNGKVGEMKKVKRYKSLGIK